MKKYLIYNPELDQATVIAKYLKKYSANNIHITGCTNSNSRKNMLLIHKKYFDEIIIDNYTNPNHIKKYDIIIPTGSHDTELVLQKYNKIKIGQITFKQKNLFVSEKPKMLKFIKSINIPIPNTYYNISEINNFPVFYKSDSETSYKKLKGIIRNKKQLLNLNLKDVIYQEFIDSKSTFAVGFLAEDGEIICSLSHEEKASFPKVGGSASYIEIINNKKLFEYTVKILHKLKYSGWGLAEYKYCEKRKDFVFMEINAKFWASIELYLLNSSCFFEKLFDIKYKTKQNKALVYLHRIFKTDNKFIFSNLGKILKQKKATSNLIKILYAFFRNLYPELIIFKFLKNFYKNENFKK